MESNKVYLLSGSDQVYGYSIWYIAIPLKSRQNVYYEDYNTSTALQRLGYSRIDIIQRRYYFTIYICTRNNKSSYTCLSIFCR